MDPMPVLHQGVLFAHVMAFAVTLSAVLRADMWLLRTLRVDPARIRRTMRAVTAGLVVLWVTGLALVALGAAGSPSPWAPSAKVAAKLVVVSVLTLNGWGLHAWVFPRLPEGTLFMSASLRLPAALGAISTASWLYAAFVGVARPLSSLLRFADFMVLYGAVICCALVLAWVLLARLPGRPGATMV